MADLFSGHDFQFQLGIFRSFCTFNAGLSQCPSDAEAPVCLIHTDAKLRTMTDLFLSADTGNTCRANDRAVNKRKEFDFIGTVCLSPQQLRFVLSGIAVLLRICE